MDAISTAKEWLKNTSDYQKGVDILQQLGCDGFTLMLLQASNDSHNKGILYDEIAKKIDAIEPSSIGLQTSRIGDDLEIDPDVIFKPNTESFDFKFDEVKQLLDERSELKAKLRFLAKDDKKQEERKTIAFRILEITAALDKIEDDKVFFQQFGYLPSGLIEPDDDPVNLKKRQSTLRTYLTRYKNHPEKLKQYSEEIAIVNAKLQKYAV